MNIFHGCVLLRVQSNRPVLRQLPEFSSRIEEQFPESGSVDSPHRLPLLVGLLDSVANGYFAESFQRSTCLLSGNSRSQADAFQGQTAEQYLPHQGSTPDHGLSRLFSPKLCECMKVNSGPAGSSTET